MRDTIGAAVLWVLSSQRVQINSVNGTTLSCRPGSGSLDAIMLIGYFLNVQGEPMGIHSLTTNPLRCRIKELNDELSGLNRHIQIKEQRMEQTTASRNFKVCDE